jgi:hypothetical protein
MGRLIGVAALALIAGLSNAVAADDDDDPAYLIIVSAANPPNSGGGATMAPFYTFKVCKEQASAIGPAFQHGASTVSAFCVKNPLSSK